MILAKSVNIFSPPFSHLWQEPDKKDDLSVQVYPAFSEYLSHSITEPPCFPIRIFVHGDKRTSFRQSLIQHSQGEFVETICSATLFPLVSSFALNMRFLGSWKHTKATANLGNGHEESDSRDSASLPVWPRRQAGQGRARAQSWRECSLNTCRNIKPEGRIRLNPCVQEPRDQTWCSVAALWVPEVKIHCDRVGGVVLGWDGGGGVLRTRDPSCPDSCTPGRIKSEAWASQDSGKLA